MTVLPFGPRTCQCRSLSRQGASPRAGDRSSVALVDGRRRKSHPSRITIFLVLTDRQDVGFWFYVSNPETFCFGDIVT